MIKLQDARTNDNGVTVTDVYSQAYGLNGYQGEPEFVGSLEKQANHFTFYPLDGNWYTFDTPEQVPGYFHAKVAVRRILDTMTDIDPRKVLADMLSGKIKPVHVDYDFNDDDFQI